MKAEEDKKDRRVSTRMTQNQYDDIQKRASEREMSISAYIVDAAAHVDNHFTLFHLLKLQNLVNLAARECEKTNRELASEIRERMKQLWLSLN